MAESESLAEVLEIVPRREVRLAEGHRDRRIGRELLEHVLQQPGEEGGVHLHLPDRDGGDWHPGQPWPTVSTTFSKLTALSPACLSPSNVDVRESSLCPERETMRAGRVSSM